MRRRALRDERGAIAIVSCLLLCFLIVPLAAVAVDLGVQRVARRDMQSMADVVALDLSRDVDGITDAAAILTAWDCPASTSATCRAAASNRVGRSVARNTSTTGATPTVTAKLGCVNDAGTFSAIGGTCLKPDAVKVDSDTSVDFNLVSGSGGAHRTAIGRSKKTACYVLGSFAARFSTNDSTLLQKNGGALNDLLGVDLDIVSYQGLAAADLSLAQLAATSQIGGVDRLLGGQVTLGQLLSATYDVLNAQGEPENSVALNVLNTASTWIGADLDAKVDLGKLVGVSTTDAAALSSYVNVLDLVSGAIALANGENFLALTDLGLGTVVDATKSYVKVIQGRQGPICGRPDVADPEGAGSASQISAHLEGGLPNLGLLTAGLGITSASGTYVANANLGASKGKLVGPDTNSYPSVFCGAGTLASPDKLNVSVTNSLASADLKATVEVAGSTTNAGSVVDVALVKNLLTALGLRVGSLLKVDYNLQVTAAAATTTPPPTGIAHLQVPQNSLGNERANPPMADGVPVSLGSQTALQLPALPVTPTVTGTITVTSSLLSLLGLVIGQDVRTITIDFSNQPDVQPLLAAVTNAINNNAVLNGARDSLNTALADLGKVLGLSLAGVDVYGVYRPECKGASLIG